MVINNKHSQILELLDFFEENGQYIWSGVVELLKYLSGVVSSGKIEKNKFFKLGPWSIDKVFKIEDKLDKSKDN
jgi:hypothetical protein